MITLPFDQLRALAKNQLCGICQSPLEVVWLAKENCYTLECSQGHRPDALVRNPSLTELWRTNELPPGPITDNIERRERQKAMSQERSTKESQFALVRHTDLGTGELLFPDQVKALVEYAYKYGLDPYRGHVVLMYGMPYIGLDGYLFYANREDPGYRLQSWPMTDKEKEQYQLGEYDHGWLAECYRSGNPNPFTGIGVVTQGETTEMSKKTPGQLRYPIVASKPWNMAQKRAEWQALRRAFPIGETEEQKEE